jgi:hypothetical protein
MYVRLAFAVAAHLEPEPRRWARRDRLPQAGPQGFANREERKPNFDRGRGLGRGFQLGERYSSERDAEFQKKCLGKMKDVAAF